VSAPDERQTLPLTHEFPFRCPKCEQPAGFPIGMTTEGRDREVIVARCRKCEHLWQLQRELGGPIARRW
jgi:DNA-directed RNA polymerase subunit M/transcription elongation factor TFIIS